MLRLRTALSLLVLLGSVACDNVGRAFDRDVNGSDPNPTPGESTIQVVPTDGDTRDGRPKVRATFPSGGGWPAGVPIVVEFSESINEATIVPSTPTGTDGRVVLRVSGTTQPLPCQYSFLAGGRLLVMRPITELSNAGVPTYEVVMLPGGRDADGLRFTVPEAGNVLASFQVNQDASFTDGRILTTYPRDNARDATRETGYWVVFDRLANANSITTTNLRVRPRGGSPVAGTISQPLSALGVADPRVVKFTPSSVLDATTTYEFVVDATITFGADGELDFKGRTPFAVFETIAPAAPTTVAIGNATSGFPNKVNRANVSTVTLQVTTPADTQVGDRVRARIYGGNAGTTATGDLVFVEGTGEATVAGSQTITVDFAGKLGSLSAPKFDDGSLSIVAQTLRGSQQSGYKQNDSSAAPSFDITPPTLLRAGPPASPDGADILTDQESLAFSGRASEPVAAATLTDGVNPAAELFAAGDDGVFLVKPITLGRLTAPRNYTLTLTDRAGNLAAAAATGRILQRGLLTGTIAGDLTVEVVDKTTLLPIANAVVVVDPGVPVRPASGQLVSPPTGASGRATFSGLGASQHTITVLRAGFHLTTVYATTASFVSIALRPITAANATSTLGGTVAFASGTGSTAVLGCSSFDDGAQIDIRTTTAAPATIPNTNLIPNRPVIVTAFGGTFEPTTAPTFTSQGIPMLGTALAVPTAPLPPLSPATAGGQTAVTIPMVPIVPGDGTLAGTIPNSYSVDFASATGLDTGNLVGGVPTVRVLAPMLGFSSQVLFGVGFAASAGGSAFTVTANFSFPAFDRFEPYIVGDAGVIATTAVDTGGRISRHRAALIGQTGSVVSPFFALAIPVVGTPSGPSTGSPSVAIDDVLDRTGGPGAAVFELVAEDGNGRRWILFGADTDVAGGQDTIQFPDLSGVGVAGLLAGSWVVRAEARVVALQNGANSGDFVFAERFRGETLYARSAPVTFTVQ